MQVNNSIVAIISTYFNKFLIRHNLYFSLCLGNYKRLDRAKKEGGMNMQETRAMQWVSTTTSPIPY